MDFFQTIKSDRGEEYSRMVTFTDGQFDYASKWAQNHNSRWPIILSFNSSYGLELPQRGVEGQVYIKKNDGFYIHSGSSWVKYF